MELFGLLTKGGGDIRDRTTEFDSHSIIGIHRVVDAARPLREVAASPTGRFQHIGQTDLLAPAAGTFSDLAIEIVPAVFDKLKTRLQAHGAGEITDLRYLLFNLSQRFDDFLQSLFYTKETIDPFLHHRIDGKIQTFLRFRAQRIDAPSHPVLKLDKFASRKRHLAKLSAWARIVAQPSRMPEGWKSLNLMG